MVYGCGATTVKCLVFFFNFLAFLAGLGLLVGSAVVYAAPGVASKVLDQIKKAPEDVQINSVQALHAVMITGMVVGSIICILGFLGCCGAITESGCMLCFFASLMIILLIVQLGVGIAALVSKNTLKGEFANFQEYLAKKAFKEPKDQGACELYQNLADSKVCCGFNSTLSFDPKICSVSATDPSITECDPAIRNTHCDEELWKVLEHLGTVIGIVALVFLFLELAATIFACCLWSAIRRGEHLYDQYA